MKRVVLIGLLLLVVPAYATTPLPVHGKLKMTENGKDTVRVTINNQNSENGAPSGVTVVEVDPAVAKSGFSFEMGPLFSTYNMEEKLGWRVKEGKNINYLPNGTLTISVKNGKCIVKTTDIVNKSTQIEFDKKVKLVIWHNFGKGK